MLLKIFLFFLNILIIFNFNIQTVLTQNVTIKNDSKILRDLEFFETNNNSSLSIKVDPNESTRNKRALGIILQGLVQALGYNTTPIQLATLPNPNTNGIPSSPVGVDIRSIPSPAAQTSAAPPPSHAPNKRPTPMPTTTMTPRQRETLRFTGVVNFGNNSDIVGHLRQYERLFHGSSTAAPVSSTPPPPRPPPASTTASSLSSSKPPLLQPYFVKIPLPLAESLRYPRPLITVVTTPASPVPVNNTNIGTSGIDERKVPKQMIPNKNKKEDDKRIVNTNPHVSCSLEEKVKGHNSKEKDNYGEGEREEVSGEYDDHKATTHDEGSEEEHSYEDKREEEPEKRPLREEEREQDEEEESGSKEGGGGEPDHEEEEEERKRGSTESYSERPIYRQQRPRYIVKGLPTGTIDNFGMKLPIEIQPFQGQLMNSYGQSLEHGGKIDENVADYFARFKNPHSGIFDPLSTVAFEGQRRKLVSDEIDGDSVEQIRGFVAPQFRYEEYDLENARVDRANAQNIRVDGGGVEIIDDEDRIENADNQNKKYLPIESTDNSEINESKPQVHQHREEIKNKKELDPNKTFVSEQFDLVNYQPYYKPVQFYYSPEFRYDKYVDFRNEPVNGENNENLKKNEPETIVEDDVERKVNVNDKNEKSLPLKTLEKYEDELAQKKSDEIENENEKMFVKRPFINQPFDFIRYQPYYKPVQYYYTPESLQKTAETITSQFTRKKSRKPNDETKHVSNEHSPEPRTPELVSSEEVVGRSTTERIRMRKNENKNAEIVQQSSEKLNSTVTNRPNNLKRRKVNRNRNNSFKQSNDEEEDTSVVEQPVTKESRNPDRTRRIRPKSY